MPLFASSDVERRYLDLYYDEREVDVLQVRFLSEEFVHFKRARINSGRKRRKRSYARKKSSRKTSSRSFRSRRRAMKSLLRFRFSPSASGRRMKCIEFRLILLERWRKRRRLRASVCTRTRCEGECEGGVNTRARC